MNRRHHTLLLLSLLAYTAAGAQDLSSYSVEYQYNSSKLVAFTLDAETTVRYAYDIGGSLVGITVGPASSVASEPSAVPVSSFHLGEIYPNPVRGSASIDFVLPARAGVRIVIHDLLGRQVSALVDESMEAGRHSVLWQPGTLASGPYVLEFSAGRRKEARLVMLVR